MADTISFYATIHQFKGDKEGETKLTLTIPALDVEQIAAFYAKNYGKRLGCALTVDQSNYAVAEEVIKTEGEGE